ncbi:Hypothetical protein R9X50_00029800 [Acrodontium crateriforme]|uniref:Uncharacterized protein n=1 Tax=Acrodontium crateriforme TaxID=150365 RepID=A0AAQ3LX00_9PEZI|nr:Hypothetical protein R9X50_00029800 [Acrodontium crateriforme]
MPEPAYTFTIPSLVDDTVLDCRIYHPRDFLEGPGPGKAQDVKGAVFAHPYAAMGGSFDDPVVLGVVETLLKLGWVVGTFNFRGAATSAGHTTWTGHAEQEDYCSVAGFVIYYIYNLSRICSPSSSLPELLDSGFESSFDQQQPLQLLLGGYSFGSLVLARLPPPVSIINRFQEAEVGTSGAEIFLRARTLAKQTWRAAEASSFTSSEPQTPLRGRAMRDAHPSPEAAETGGRSSLHRVRASPVTVGGEETDSRDRRTHSRGHHSARQSLEEVVRRSVEIPRRIVKSHHAHHPWHKSRSHERGQQTELDDGHSRPSTPTASTPTANTTNAGLNKGAPVVSTRYLLISPVLFPFTHTLCPPGASMFSSTTATRRGHHQSDGPVGAQFLSHPTLAIFGSADGFTSNKRLQGWAQRQVSDSTSKASGQDEREARFEWAMIEHAGHFWREAGVMRRLQEQIMRWKAF